MIANLIIYTFNITLALVIVLLNYNIPHRSREDRMILGLVFLILMEMLIQWGIHGKLTADGPGGSIRFLIFGLMYAPTIFLIGQTKRDELSLRKAKLHGIPFSIFMVLFLIWMLFPGVEKDFTLMHWIVNGVVLLSFIAYFTAEMISIRRSENRKNTLFSRFLFLFWGIGLSFLSIAWIVGVVFRYSFVHAGFFLIGVSLLFAGLLLHLYRFYFLKFKHQYLLSEREIFSYKSLILDLFAKEAIETTAYTSEEEEGEKKILAEIDFLDPEINLSSLASKMNMSVSFIEKRIKEETGTSFKNFVNMKRVKHAQNLLEKKSDLPMRELMVRSGFRSTATFYRNFKNYAGVTPKEYKAQFSDKK